MAMGAGRDSRDLDDYGEADLEAEDLGPIDERCSYPPGRARRESDIYALTVPPGEYPVQRVPGSIEQALREAAEQVPRAPTPAPPEVDPSKEPTVVVRRVRRVRQR